jgi:tetratricopeptide (TPR) repeat protein
MARILIIVTSLLAVGLLTGCDLFTRPTERVARAEQLIASGAYGEALVELNVALEKSPNDARAQLALARVSLQLGNPDAASRALDVAQKSGGDAAQLAELRARVLLQQGKPEAVLAATDAGKPDISSPAREELRLRALTALHRYPDAIELARSIDSHADAAGVAAVSLAEGYARLGNPDGARALLDATVKQHPEAAEAWLARGRLQQIDGKLPEAEQSLAKALSSAGGKLTLMQQLNAASALADIQLARGDLPAAQATHQQMVKLAPDGALATLLAGRLTLAEGKATEAVAAFQELIAKHADFDEVRVALASAQIANGTLEQALQQTSTLAQKNPSAGTLKLAGDVLRRMATLKADGEDYQLSAASVHLALGQPFMARLSLRKAAEIAPDAPQPRAALAQLELRTGNVAEARRLATALLEKQPKDPSALALLAESSRVAGEYAQAAKALEQLWTQGPSAATALALARVRDEGKLGNAPAALEAWVVKNPDDLKMRGAYADALRQAGQNGPAIAQFETLVAAAPTVVPALNNLAWLYYLEKDPRAVATAKRAWQLAPHAPSVGDTYGWLLVESGAVQEGLNVLEGAWNDGGLADPELRYHYAATLVRAGQAERAAPRLTQLLAEVPEFPSRAAAQTLAGTLR